MAVTETTVLLAMPDADRLSRYGSRDGLLLRADQVESGVATDGYYRVSVPIDAAVGDILFLPGPLPPTTPGTVLEGVEAMVNPPLVGAHCVLEGRLLTIRDLKERVFLRVQTAGGNVLQVVVEGAATARLKLGDENLNVGHMIRVGGTLQSRMGNKRPDALPVELVMSESDELAWYGQPDLQPGILSQKGPKSGVVLAEAFTLITTQGSSAYHYRHPVMQQVSELGAAVLQYWSDHFASRGYVQFASTTMLSGSAEGGAAPFTVRGYDVQLAQSPQLEKELFAISLLKPVYATAPAFRNDPSNTRVHLPEFLSLDAEIPNLDPGRDTMELVMDELQEFVRELYVHLGTRCSRALAELGLKLPRSTQPFPRIPFSEAREMLAERIATAVRHPRRASRLYGDFITELGEISPGKPVDEEALSSFVLGEDSGDLTSRSEKAIIQYAQELTGFPAVFVTGFPRSRKPFYIQPEGEEGTRSFDLLLAHREISSGGERVSDHQVLREQLRRFDLLDGQGEPPASLRTYYDSIRLGAPRHGGFGMGFERLLHMVLDGALHAKFIRPIVPFPMDLYATEAKPGR